MTEVENVGQQRFSDGRTLWVVGYGIGLMG